MPSENTIEVWRDVQGFEGYYQASTFGRIRSLDRIVRSGKGRKPNLRLGVILIPRKVWGGYLQVTLQKEGKGTPFMVGPLVLRTFVGPCPPGMECCHDPDRDRANNRLDNLRWDTRSNNSHDRVRHGTQVNNRGERNHNAKLTDEQVLEIRRRHKAGEGTKPLSAEFKVSGDAIRRVVYGRVWKHLLPKQEVAMPGSVSDSYDPEFGTGENASLVAEAIRSVKQRVTDVIGSDALKDIVKVASGKPGRSFTATLTEREWRLIRFAINRALESL